MYAETLVVFQHVNIKIKPYINIGPEMFRYGVSARGTVAQNLVLWIKYGLPGFLKKVNEDANSTVSFSLCMNIPEL